MEKYQIYETNIKIIDRAIELLVTARKSVACSTIPKEIIEEATKLVITTEDILYGMKKIYIELLKT